MNIRYLMLVASLVTSATSLYSQKGKSAQELREQLIQTIEFGKPCDTYIVPWTARSKKALLKGINDLKPDSIFKEEGSVIVWLPGGVEIEFTYDEEKGKFRYGGISYDRTFESREAANDYLKNVRSSDTMNYEDVNTDRFVTYTTECPPQINVYKTTYVMDDYPIVHILYMVY